jgi:hypothetical protein
VNLARQPARAESIGITQSRGAGGRAGAGLLSLSSGPKCASLTGKMIESRKSNFESLIGILIDISRAGNKPR